MKIELKWFAVKLFKWEIIVDRIKWFDSFGNECFLRIKKREELT